jgi:hypothetical protein
MPRNVSLFEGDRLQLREPTADVLLDRIYGDGTVQPLMEGF